MAQAKETNAEGKGRASVTAEVEAETAKARRRSALVGFGCQHADESSRVGSARCLCDRRCASLNENWTAVAAQTAIHPTNEPADRTALERSASETINQTTRRVTVQRERGGGGGEEEEEDGDSG